VSLACRCWCRAGAHSSAADDTAYVFGLCGHFCGSHWLRVRGRPFTAIEPVRRAHGPMDRHLHRRQRRLRLVEHEIYDHRRVRAGHRLAVDVGLRRRRQTDFQGSSLSASNGVTTFSNGMVSAPGITTNVMGPSGRASGTCTLRNGCCTPQFFESDCHTRTPASSLPSPVAEANSVMKSP
jgi:hypothetical protein